MFNVLRRKKEKEKDENPASKEDLLDMEILEVEKRFQDTVAPAETYIMMTQSILVWENPKYTAVFILCANILFWLATTMKIYRLVGLTGLVLVFSDMWTTKIWPEIAVPPPEGEDTEGWTEVHPRLLSVPELCHYAAVVWTTVNSYLSWLIHLRRNHHAKFFFLMVIVLGSGAVLGTYISGIMLIYIFVMGSLMLPGLIYHRFIEKFVERAQPIIHRTEKYFNVKRKRTKKSKKKPGSSSLESSLASLVDESDDSEHELLPEELLPSFELPVTGIPQIVQTGADGEDGETFGVGLAVPGSDTLPHSDLELSDEELAMIPKRSMPAFDDSRLDESHSDLEQDGHLEVPDVDTQGSDSELDETLLQDPGQIDESESGEEDPKGLGGMFFKDRHFKESSGSSSADEDEEEKLLRGLSIPDVNDESLNEPPEGFLGTITHQVASAVTADAVSQNISSLMSSTMYGLNRIQETVRGAVQSAPASATAAPPEPTAASKGDITDMTDSLDSDILAEFDFLEDEDMSEEVADKKQDS